MADDLNRIERLKHDEKERIKKEMDKLELEELEINKKRKDLYNQLKKIEKEENSWITRKLPIR